MPANWQIMTKRLPIKTLGNNAARITKNNYTLHLQRNLYTNLCLSLSFAIDLTCITREIQIKSEIYDYVTLPITSLGEFAKVQFAKPLERSIGQSKDEAG